RYIANRSSGAQGTAIAAALRDLGARVTFVTGPAEVAPPEGVAVVPVATAAEMAAAVDAALPADVAVMAAAVADWRVANASGSKMKKGAGGMPSLTFAENPDILAGVSKGARRPGLVVGFAAETDDVTVHAQAKRVRKGCDWIVANDVSPGTGIMGGAENAVTLVTAEGAEDWPRLSKVETARRLARRIAEAL
ncbi:MAG: phosphopantothenoylcysteine decarboxylase, partial [Pseudomonadota bacterium]